MRAAAAVLLAAAACLAAIQYIAHAGTYTHLHRDTAAQARILAALAAQELHGAPCSTDTDCTQRFGR
jgi:hypothetical protein